MLVVVGVGRKSALAGLFGDNSQTIGLSSALSPASLNSAYSGGGEITISGDALLPDTGVLGGSVDADENSLQSDQISLYVVRSGDSLSGIAKMFNVSVNTIRWANDLSRDSVIKEGQTLTILPIDGVRHTVAKGETLSGMAKKFKGDTKEIMQFNGLTSETDLAVGRTLFIPGGEEPETTGTPGSSPRKPIVRGASGPSYSGYYIRPVEGGVKTQGLHGYNGVDLGNQAGAPIVASASGRVIVSRSGGWNGGYGTYVVIEHPNGTQTLYAHNSRNIVSVGQQVVQGQIIAYVGSTGRSTGSHVHFEIRGAKNPF